MKHVFRKLSALVVLSATTAVVAGPGWTKADRKEFTQACVADLESQYPGEDVAGYCDCVLDQIVRKHSAEQVDSMSETQVDALFKKYDAMCDG